MDSNSSRAGNAGSIQLSTQQSADCSRESGKESARRARQRKADPAEYEDSSAVQAEDAKFEDRWEFIIDPTAMQRRGDPEKQSGAEGIGSRATCRGSQRQHRRKRFRATWKLACRCRKRSEEPGKPGSSQSLRDQQQGSRRDSRSRRDHHLRREQRGNSRLKPNDGTGGSRSRSDLGATTTRSRKIRETGRPGQRVIGDTEGRMAGATRRPANRHRRRMRESRRLESPSPAKPDDIGRGVTQDRYREALRRGVTKRGDPPTHANRQRGTHARFGDTRDSIAGIANGLKRRGNSHLRRRRGRRAQKAGQPEEAWRAKSDAEGTGGTRSLSEMPKGSMRFMELFVHHGERREPQGYRRFHLRGNHCTLTL